MHLPCADCGEGAADLQATAAECDQRDVRSQVRSSEAATKVLAATCLDPHRPVMISPDRSPAARRWRAATAGP